MTILANMSAAQKEELGLAVARLPRSKAIRVLRAAARGITPIDQVATGVTLSVGAGGAASTINGATTAFGQGMYQPDSPLIEQVGGAITSNGTSGYLMQANTNQPGVRFCTDSKNVDICIFVDDTVGVIGYVTDLRTGVRARVQAADIVGNFTYRYLKLAFPTAQPRLIEWYINSACIMRGINVDSGYTIWKAPRADEPRIGLLWDSWGINTLNAITSGTTATNKVRLGTVDYLAEALGVPSIFSSSKGGVGFLQGGPTYRARLEAGVFNPANVGDMDLVIVPGSINDNNAAWDATLQAEQQATIAGLMTIQPNAIIVGTGPQSTYNGTAGTSTAQSRYDMYQGAFLAAAGADPRMIWIDNSPTGQGWYASNARNLANNGSDNLHPNDLGKVYYGARMGEAIIGAIRSRFSL